MLRPVRLKLLIALALAVATATAYAPVRENGFVNYDDDLYVSNNQQVRMGLTAESVGWAFTSFHGANWFPLTRLSWMLDAEVFGLEPRGFHYTSLLLHGLNGILVFAVFARMTGSIWPSAFVAAAFALHPLHVESVAWVAARKDVLSGLFALLALLAYERYARGGGSKRHYLAVFACLALGLMAKPTLVSLPFVLLLLDEWPLGRLRRAGAPQAWDPARVRRAVLEKLPLLALVVVASGITVAAQRSWGTVQSLELYPLGVRMENALVAYVAYLADAFWPTGLAVFYPHPGYALSPWRVAGAAALLAGISAVAAFALRRRPYLGVGWFWFLGMLVPVIGLVQVGQAAMADRYTYLPLIGLSVALAWGIRELVAGSRPAGRAAALLGAALLGALAFATAAQVRTWKDSSSLFEHALRVTDRNHVAHINLGVELLGEDRLSEAAAHLQTALRLAPRSALAHGLLADVRTRQERPEDALPHYRAALRLARHERDEARWLAAWANALLAMEKLGEAEAKYRGALRLEPELASLHANLGLTLLRRGKLEQAIASLQEGVRLDPEQAEAHGNLGLALAEDGEPERAIDHYRRALALRPNLARVHANLGRALLDGGDVDAALAHLAEAIRLEPEQAGHRANQASALQQLGREAEAIDAYRAALRLGERAPAFLNNLAWLLATGEHAGEQGAEEAVRLAREAAVATGFRNAGVLDTLAVAYAAAGRMQEAVRTAEAALELAEASGDADFAAAIRGRLDAYARER
jgi:tetratricopeptide (TPR) repeat protein